MISDLLGRGTRAYKVQKTILGAQEIDAQFNLHGGNDERLSYMPYQLADFTAILFEAVAETNGNVFLDVGAGPGSKMAIAEELFGLDVYGIEIDESMVLRSEYYKSYRLGCACALTSNVDYELYDIIWLYRPFRDPVKEAELELKIRREMKPGAILAGGAWELSPYESYAEGDAVFSTIVDDWDAKRGAYKKVR